MGCDARRSVAAPPTMRVAALLLLIASAVGTPDELSDDGSVVMTNGNATFVVRLRPRNAEALESVVRAAVLGDTDGARAAMLALRERLELKIERVRLAGRADKAEKAAAELDFVNSKALAAKLKRPRQRSRAASFDPGHRREVT